MNTSTSPSKTIQEPSNHLFTPICLLSYFCHVLDFNIYLPICLSILNVTRCYYCLKYMFIFLGSKITVDGESAMKLKDTCSLEEKL